MKNNKIMKFGGFRYMQAVVAGRDSKLLDYVIFA
jgi:hypothetical protein